MKNEVAKVAPDRQPRERIIVTVDVAEAIHNYDRGLLTVGELLNQLTYWEKITKNSAAHGGQVFFFCSAGTHFAIQNGVCWRLIFTCNTQQLNSPA